MKYFELTENDNFLNVNRSLSVPFDSYIHEESYIKFGDRIHIDDFFSYSPVLESGNYLVIDNLLDQQFLYDRIDYWLPYESQTKIDTLSTEDLKKQELINIDFNSIKRVYPDGTIKRCVSDRPFNVGGRNEYPAFDGVRSVLDRRRKVPNQSDPSPDSKKDEKSLERVRKKIFDLVMLNSWDWFLTLTLDQDKIDRTDVRAAGSKLRQWINDHLVKKYEDVRYLAVYEQHKKSEQNGKRAYHFHMLLSGVPAEAFVDSGTCMIQGHKDPMKYSTFNLMKKLGHATDSDFKCPVFNVPSYKLGFSTAIQIYKNGLGLACYMTKYITKDLNKTELPFGKAAYFRSRGNLVEEPDIYYGIFDVKKVPANAFQVSKEYGNYYFWDNIAERTKPQLEMFVFGIHPRLIAGFRPQKKS